jgi:hypothetical protein
MVADGFPNSAVSQWDCEHIILSKAHADNGNTPRCVGALSAINQGFESILFLDADNWYCPNHASEALKVKRNNPEIDIAVLGRNIVLPDGTPVNEDPEDSARTHIDTSCHCFFESAFGLLPIWGMTNPFFGPICDRTMFFAIKQKTSNQPGRTKKHVIIQAIIEIITTSPDSDLLSKQVIQA